jgi:periplasmic protein TonB
MSAVPKSLLLRDDDWDLRRWFFSAAVVVALHAALIFWLMHRHELTAADAPPAVVMIDLPAMDVAPASEVPPEAMEGPQMTKAQPEVVETPEAMEVPELPPAQKPAAVLIPPPKPKAKPKKKEIQHVVKESREPPAPHTSAPRHSTAARGQMSAASRRGTAGSGASTSSWRAEIFAHLLRHKPSGGEAKGTARVSFTLSQSGALLGSHLAGSSGSSALDQKAMQMVRSANPFPAAPADVTGGSFSFTVPVLFH